ncbi:ethanolaminephosphotransferase 1 isoform X2 [Neodiprion pinetum]|uniref:Ethanolaminephosphotransferase 1 isoform X2 n=1 Tax=Neodiprion lecontei TaxID=441921 RepID=A0ABM3FNB0_NEOLC|nr:ethanolaminephosphotransferase 1-like isoform X2 [Neodiprion pinetum]XP_046589505.1 ethanolaminephosphotransferase 1 isoform X2 [Neodiprion lecontei]XP_046609192.1 ethanolaminephosphotransferase 1-like isoform X2 [Neodiprion virginianus]
MKLEVDYLTQEHLMGFENYKYCPKWVAPNLLTFTGFLFTVVNFLMFASYDYYYYASSDNIPEYPNIPRWVYAMAAFNIFMAYTLDGIDGKQARRTQTSGPLGELFDHGLDSWTAMLITVCMYSVFGRTDHSVAPLRMYFILWNVFINFYLSHWEKYNTGVLFLPWGYDASMLATIIVFVLTTFAGHEAWKFELPGGISAGIMFEILLYVSALVSNLPMVVWNIYKSYRDKTGKMRSFPEAVRPLVPATIFFTIATFWVIYSPNNIMEKDPRMIYFAIGTIFSNICCRLIVSQMSNTRCEIFPWILIPVAGAVACSFMVPSIELEIMYLVSIFALVAHIHYGTCVVRQMCHHFRIYTFHIREHSE